MRNSVPLQFTIGESLAWRKSFSDYPASGGWTLTYSFRGAGAGFDAVASADGEDFLITVAKTVSALCSPGKYYFAAFVEKGAEKYQVDSGETEVKISIGALGVETQLDNRSQAKKILDAIDALVAGKASLDQQEYTIGDRQLRRYPLPDLIQLRKTYAALVAQEKRAEQKKSGKSIFKNSFVRFQKPR